MLHHLMVGTWTPPGAIYTISFNDANSELSLLKKTTIPHDEPISWMTFDHTGRNIYGASMKKFSSHAVKSPTDIEHRASFPIGGHPSACKEDTNTRAIFVLAAKKPPYNVYGNPFYKYAGYGNIFSVNAEGTMMENIQNYQYNDRAAVHGMVFDPTETYLYSADMWDNKIWTHEKSPTTGKLTTIDGLDAPSLGDHPRWVAMHPSGKYLYALMEAGNYLAECVIDKRSHTPAFTHRTYPLVPPDMTLKNYRSDVCALAQSGKYLFATSRANPKDVTGYISAFRLSEVGSIEKQLFLNPTPTSGGHSNAVSPCPWSDEWLALTDDSEGWIEMYRFKDERLARVAHLDVRDPGFCMNAIWYD